MLELSYTVQKKFRNDLSLFQEGKIIGKYRLWEYLVLGGRKFIRVEDNGAKIFYSTKEYASISKALREEKVTTVNVNYKNKKYTIVRNFFGVFMTGGNVKLFYQEDLVGEIEIDSLNVIHPSISNSGKVRIYDCLDSIDSGVYIAFLFYGLDSLESLRSD